MKNLRLWLSTSRAIYMPAMVSILGCVVHKQREQANRVDHHPLPLRKTHRLSHIVSESIFRMWGYAQQNFHMLVFVALLGNFQSTPGDSGDSWGQFARIDLPYTWDDLPTKPVVTKPNCYVNCIANHPNRIRHRPPHAYSRRPHVPLGCTQGR